MDRVRSFAAFGTGTFIRFLFLASPVLLLGWLDVFDKLWHALFGVDLVTPEWLVYLFIAIGVFAAAAEAYHTERTQRRALANATAALNTAIGWLYVRDLGGMNDYDR